MSETDSCLYCGFPRREHSYNGACYGLCGQFVEFSAKEAAVEIERLKAENEKLREALGIRAIGAAP